MSHPSQQSGSWHRPISTLLLLSGMVAGTVFVSSNVLRFESKSHAQSSRLSQSKQEVNQKSNPSPTTGGLFAEVDGKKLSFPLKQTDVEANISGNLSRVEVKQTFTNPYDRPLEAIYQFPLPEDAAVDDMEIRIGNRIIRGVIKERQEAKQIYETAKQEGKTAALLEQERANLFTQSLANIVPGETIEVVIRYTNSLEFEGGDYEFVFPTVVGPRYIPGDQIDAAGNTTRVTDAAKITPPLLPPSQRSGNDISITVNLDAGVPIRNLRSPSHPILTSKKGQQTQVKLANQKTIPNKDLILRYQVASKQTQATLLTQSDQRGGHFATYLIPALKYKSNQIVPKDVVFLIDTSGSQGGPPIVQSKKLMTQFLDKLNPNDTFSIINFSNTTSKLSPKPLANTPANRKKALEYIKKLDANGGTELMNGINTVAAFPPAPDGRLRSVVLLTDGLIGNDETIIAAVRDRLKPGNRIYPFGVGFSTNRFLLDRLAEVGRGTVEVVAPKDSAEKVAAKFVKTINKPVLTDIEVSWVGPGKGPDIYPLRVPDLFANQPLVLHGRKQDGQSGKLKITGRMAGGKPYEQVLEVKFDASGNEAIAQLWGRNRIKSLMNQMYGRESDPAVKQVLDTALAYRLLSKYTAFVAVTEEIRVDPNNPNLKQRVPVDLPEGMKLTNPAAHATPEPSEILGYLIALFGIFLVMAKKHGLKWLPTRRQS
ncbi:VIT domain-containing protein [Acaryochloris sp. IP29b_bin.137]|uniref:VIT and vWA domain-containing protein n=1 Tax=Acaryochloris sp. IP29b_bin.137 TaxID=2969217 RepID=UPI00260463A8|nr:VIT domain-containing protein [Acaryochloris sp. IP29b_bin.137]